MEIVEGILEEPKTIVFKSRFKKLDKVLHTASGRRGTITRIWGKEIVHKFDDQVVVKCLFEYTVTPFKQSYNKFRCKESELAILNDSGVAF